MAEVRNKRVVIEFKKPIYELEVFHKEDGILKKYFERDYNPAVKKAEITIPDKRDIYIGNMDNVESITTKSFPKKVFKNPYPKEKNDKPKGYKIIKMDMPFIAYTNAKAGIIYTGTEFEKLPHLSQEFVIEHEKAHRYFDDEHKTDLEALKEMSKRRYAPGAAYFCLKRTLTPSEENRQRIQKLEKYFRNAGN